MIFPRAVTESVGFLGRTVVDDSAYSQYIKSCNGGLYFSGSLWIYSRVSESEDFSLTNENEIIKKSYDFVKDIAQKCAFACDAFNNQFLFSSKGIEYMDIETGECQFFARNFSDWVQAINENSDYLTGEPYYASLLQSKEMKGSDYYRRILANRPFVIGGDFALENMRLSDMREHVAFNSHLARQLHNLPDKTNVRISLIPPK